MLICCWAWAAPIGAHAQPDFKLEADFFQSQLPEYQRWLDSCGLGKYLRAVHLHVDTGLVLLLDFPYDPPATVPSLWRRLRIDFKKAHGETLERRLIEHALTVFDIDRQHFALQVASETDDCFFYQMFGVKYGFFLADSSSCKGSKSDTLRMRPPDLSRVRRGGRMVLPPPVSPQHTMFVVKDFLQKRYAADSCAGRPPTLQWTVEAANDDALELEVTDLCHEVIPANHPKLCTTLKRCCGLPCTWKQREKLRLRVRYQYSEAQGMALDIWVDGRYGPDTYAKSGRRGYRDMGTDFERELEAYTRRLVEDLRRELGQ